jgi:Ca2+-binding RTX toxin-like protein
MARPAPHSFFHFGSRFRDTLIGTADDDVILGYEGDDALFGGEGRDFLYGGDGDDTLSGEGGNDYLDGGDGADILDGGSGEDSINYHDSDAAVAIDLSALTASGGDAEGDVLVDIEFVRGSVFNDTIIGDDGDNFLCGIGGNDTLYGGGGDDILRGAEDADHLDGGSGTDTATYWSSSAGVTIDLLVGTGLGGHAQGDTLVSIEKVQGSEFFDDTLIGSNVGVQLYGYGGNDTLLGGTGADLLAGGVGADTLSGGRGKDMLFGEDGDDTLNGGEGADLITAGLGNDTIAGGNGRDQFKFRQGDGVDVITDFQAGLDRIIFSDHKTTWRDLTTEMSGDDAHIYYGADDLLVVEGASLADVWGAFGFY